MICVHIPRLCYDLSSVIGSLGSSIVFGYMGILLIFGIFLAYQTQSVKLKQVSDSRFVGMSIYNVVERNQKQILSIRCMYIYIYIYISSSSC